MHFEFLIYFWKKNPYEIDKQQLFLACLLKICQKICAVRQNTHILKIFSENKS